MQYPLGFEVLFAFCAVVPYPLVHGMQGIAPVGAVVIENPEVHSFVHKRVSELCVVQIGEDINAEMLVIDQTADSYGAIKTAGMKVDHFSMIVFLEPAQSISRPMRFRDPRRGIELLGRHHTLRGEQRLIGLRLQQTCAGYPGAVEQAYHPFVDVVCAAPHRTRGVDTLYLDILYRLDDAVPIQEMRG